MGLWFWVITKVGYKKCHILDETVEPPLTTTFLQRLSFFVPADGPYVRSTTVTSPKRQQPTAS